MNRETIEMEIDWLNAQIAIIEKQLKKLPEGKLLCRQNGNYVKWYKKINGEVIYLPKKEEKQAAALAQGTYLSLLLNQYMEDRNQLTKLNEKLAQPNKKNKFEEIDSYKELLEQSWQFYPMNGYSKMTDKQILDWVNQPYETNKSFPENLIHHTNSGVVVRSKSEAIIANALLAYNIPFRYECRLTVDNKDYFPDFTILRPDERKLIVWEHFGKMDDKKYRTSSIQKMTAYESIGIYSPRNLIITCEDGNRPLSMTEVEYIIKTKIIN